MEKEIIKLFEKYIDYVQLTFNTETPTKLIAKTDEVILQLMKLKRKYENQ